MTTVVVTTEEDPVLAAVRFTSELAWADAGPEVSSFFPFLYFLQSILNFFFFLSEVVVFGL